MERRVAQRPLLVERAATVNARLAVEHRFADALKKSGVEEDIECASSSAAGKLSSTVTSSGATSSDDGEF